WRSSPRLGVHTFGRDGSLESLQRDAVQEEIANAATFSGLLQRYELLRRRQPCEPRRRREARHEHRYTPRIAAIEKILRGHPVGRVRLGARRLPPGRDRVAAPRPHASEAEVELDGSALRIEA